METSRPLVAIGVFVFRSSGQFVIGKRKGSTNKTVGNGTYALPGGHLEFGESFEECATREVLEETGLSLKDVRLLTVMNNVMEKEGKHYVTLFMRGSVEGDQAEPQLMEPDKCEGWEWSTWEEMKNYYELQVEGEKKGNFQGRKLFSPWANMFKNLPDFRPS